MKHNFIQDKAYLDSLVFDAKKLIRLSHEHAKLCESFHRALKEEYNEAGSQPTPSTVRANSHSPTSQLGSECSYNE